MTLESDKATMEVPSSLDGVVKEVRVKVGDTLSEGSVVVIVEEADAAAAAATSTTEPPAKTPSPAKPEQPATPSPPASSTAVPAAGKIVEAKVPDVGDYSGIPVIELLVSVGDTVKKDQGLVTLESDKATMEVPSSHAGVIKELKVKIGDSVSEGSVVALIESTGDAAPATSPSKAARRSHSAATR